MSDHSHCPDGCDHPQPRVVLPDKSVSDLGLHVDPSKPLEICGRCWVKFGDVVPMVPCTPHICAEANA